MNKKFAICSALLVLGSMTVLARDSKPGIFHINGGATTVAVRPSRQKSNAKAIEPVASPFYNNIGTSGYEQYVGYAVCAALKSCGGEWTPANQFTSLKTGITRKISLGLGLCRAQTGLSLSSPKTARTSHAPIRMALPRRTAYVRER